VLPWFAVHLNGRIYNSGPIAVDVLSITSRCEDKYKFGPLGVMTSECFTVSLEPLRFPFRLEPGQIFRMTLISPIQPQSSLTSAQIASRMRELLSNSTNTLDFSLATEVANENGERFTFRVVKKVNGRPLWDMLITRWQDIGEADLVRLAGGVFTPKKAKIEVEIVPQLPTEEINNTH
jgi:hypothetical protein